MLIMITLKDNLTERLASHNVSILRLGHPARVLPSIVGHTLDARIHTSSGGAILSNLRSDIHAVRERLSLCKEQNERPAILGELVLLHNNYCQRKAELEEKLVSSARIILSTLNGYVYGCIPLVILSLLMSI
jgi:DNA polymerase alpha-associated DNA helicase A